MNELPALNLIRRFSWFWLHNETVNIWSHFIGFLIFFYNLASIVISPPERTESNLELLPLIIQLISYQVKIQSNSDMMTGQWVGRSYSVTRLGDLLDFEQFRPQLISPNLLHS